MASINQISFQETSNQKIIVEELIESELKGIVGGADATVIQNDETITNGSNSSVTVDQSNQEVIAKDRGSANVSRKIRWFVKDLLRNVLS